MKLFLFALLGAVSLTGCVTHYHYDSVAQDVIRELNTRTNEVAKDGDSGRLSLVQSQKFLKQSQAMVGVLHSRANYSGMSEEARAYLDTLDGEYAALLRRNKPLRTPAVGELQTTLIALGSLEPLMRVTMVEEVASPSTDDIGEDLCEANRRDEKTKKHDKKDKCESKNKDDKKDRNDKKDKGDKDDKKDKKDDCDDHKSKH